MKTLLCAGALALALTASAAAKPGTAVTTVNLRAEANTTSEILGKIQGGSRLDVGDCTGGWCAVTWAGKSGFAIATALDLSGRPMLRRGPPPGYIRYQPYPPPAYIVGPRPYYYGPPLGYYGWGWGPGWGWRGGWRGGWRRW